MSLYLRYSINTMQTPQSDRSTLRYIPLLQSLGFLLRRKRLLGLSLLLFCCTILLTWMGYQLSLDFIDGLTQGFFVAPPEPDSILGWFKHKGWFLLKYLYLFISRVVSFYLAFLIAYSLTTPGYGLLSTAAEKLHAGDDFELDDGLTVRGVLLDLYEGIKIAAFGILVTVAALMANFVPIIGQILAFLFYTYYSALMFLDYPASRRRWSLSRKIEWMKKYKGHCFRLGLFPALVSMVPILNIFLIATLFPILTVHATLNFTSLELQTNGPLPRKRNGNRN